MKNKIFSGSLSVDKVNTISQPVTYKPQHIKGTNVSVGTTISDNAKIMNDILELIKQLCKDNSFNTVNDIFSIIGNMDYENELNMYQKGFIKMLTPEEIAYLKSLVTKYKDIKKPVIASLVKFICWLLELDDE